MLDLDFGEAYFREIYLVRLFPARHFDRAVLIAGFFSFCVIVVFIGRIFGGAEIIGEHPDDFRIGSLGDVIVDLIVEIGGRKILCHVKLLDGSRRRKGDHYQRKEHDKACEEEQEGFSAPTVIIDYLIGCFNQIFFDCLYFLLHARNLQK